MYPAIGSYFQVVFQGIDDPNGGDEGFLSVSGLQAGLTEMNGVAGATNRGGVVLLKRAVRAKAESALTRWLFSNLEVKNPAPLALARVNLLDESREPFMSWILYSITPRSWRLGELNGERSEILIEEIELYYERLGWG
jgi:phage tail-like protein